MSFTLEEYIDGTRQNAHNTLNRYPEHAAVLRRINDAFDHVLGFLSSNPETAVIFAPMAHADFLAAMRLALGGELPASFGASRACVEAALYAFFLFRNPHLNKVWAARHKDEAARKRVRKDFTYVAMVKTLTTYLEKVGSQADFAYQTTIDLGAHPNIMKLFANLTHDEAEDPEWQYINLQKADVTIAIRGVAMCAIAALNIFKLIWATDVC